ncbi:vanadium-dependent haloperoxidase [Flavitalea flava]
MNKKTFYFLLSLVVLTPLTALRSQARQSSGDSPDWEKRTNDPDYIHRSVKQVTDVIVHDIFSPPVASRIYAYVTIAGYEAARNGSTDHFSFAGQLNDLKPLPVPDSGIKLSYSLAAVQAILLVGKALVISEEQMEVFHDKMIKEFKDARMPEEVYTNSLGYGKKIADQVLAWAGRDNYKQTRSFPKYDVSEDSGTWKPTPPAYMKAVEPHWSKMRTFVMDSARQFKPGSADTFSTDKNSRFYKDALEVYYTGLRLQPEQKAIADFWDCNPFKMNVNGHVMFATKKISPGGHWINITALACKKNHLDFIRSLEAYADISIVIADGFIGCWDEKYTSKLIRPESFINQYIDQQWMPLLQTPPFPEHTSGHSVVSACAAVMLTKLFGDNFSFGDSTELEFGIPARQFMSFRQAAQEAAISRLYGGIHFRPAIVAGLEEGDKIGTFIAAKLKTSL